MRINKLLGIAAASLGLLAGATSQAQPYSNAVMSVNPPPVGYWPLTETTQPPTPGSLNLTAHNSGTLGTAGDGLYGAWFQASGASWYLTNNVVLTNAQLTGDGSMALSCDSEYTKAVPGQYVVVPHTSNGVANDALTIKAPFSVECWVLFGSTNSAARVLVAQGPTRTDCGGSDPNNPYNGGTFQGLSGFELGQYQDYLFFMPCATNGFAKPELDTSGYNKFAGFKVGQLVHVVATLSATGTKTIYTNGVLCVSGGSTANGAGLKYVPDPVSPIMIGAGPEVSISKAVPTEGVYSPFSGLLDEVAIYTNALTVDQASAHYLAAANGTYNAAVLADSPMLYYRFDDSITPANAGYNTASFPTATNYGLESVNANGLYQPGTTPGVAGPGYSGFGANSRAVALNGAFGTVNIGNGNLPASLNPTGAVPLTVVSWFKGGPADSPNRFQEIVGHGDSSYRLGLGWTGGNNTGTNVGHHFNAGPGPELQFANIKDETTNSFALNDGAWHMVAGVSDGTNEYLYLDGRLAKTASNASGINIPGSTNDLVLGGDPLYTYASAGTEYSIRNYNGSIAQVAFWTNALSQAQIQTLYGAASVPPTIAMQPQPINTNAGSVVALSVVVRGSPTFTYQWYKDGGLVSGATSSSLTFNPIALSNGGTYYVAVTNSGGYAISGNATVTVVGPPVINAQSPADLRVFANTTPTLYVNASGPSLTYQWNVNGGAISGATNSSYILPPVTVNASYTCTITNSYGPGSFTPINLTVQADPAFSYPQAVLADHPISYYRLWETAGTTAYDYAGGLNATYTNVLLNQQPGYSQNDPTVGSAQFGSLSTVDSFAGYTPSFLNFAAPAGTNAAFSIEAWVNGSFGQTLDAGLVTCGYGNGGEQFDLDTGGNFPNHYWRFIVRDASGAAHGVNGTTGPTDGNWHHLVGVCDQPNGIVRLYVDGVQEGTQTIGATAGILPWNTPMSIGSRESIQGTNYDAQFSGWMNDVAIYNYALSATQVANHYDAVGVAPVITMQPTNTTVNDGGTAYFYATASGTAPLSYQWYDANSNLPLGNQTNSTLTLSNVNYNTMNNNVYKLTVTNLYGSMDSAFVVLTIVAGPPNIDVDLQPLYAIGYAGTPFAYSVSVSGSAPIRYQWKFNGNNIAGATTSVYSGKSVVGTNNYQVAVTNSAGYALSSIATNIGIAVPTLNPSDYTYKMKITFNGYASNETLVDFPALVLFGTNVSGFSYSQLASPVGGDLRFTDASGTREIPHEIDEWNPSGNSAVWVQVPTLSPTNDAIWAYWGNPSATTSLQWTTNGETWVPAFGASAPYQVVYHLKEGAFPFADGTTLHPATNGAAPGVVSGVVGTAGAFNGAAWLDVGTNDIGDGCTLSAWVNVNSGASSIQTIWANQRGGYGSPGFAWWVNNYGFSDQIMDLATGDGAGGGNESKTATGLVQFGSWHALEVAINRTNGTAQFFYDGTLAGTTTAVVKDFTTLGDLRLGLFEDNNFGMNGSMDEARVRSAINSPSWVWADYMTVANNSAFQSYSTVSSSAVTITYQVINSQLVLTWPQGTLLSGTEVTGITNVVSGATSPYTNSLAGPRTFFRVKVR